MKDFWGRISGKLNFEVLIVVILGVVFILLILLLAVAIPSPTPFQEFAFRLVLALAAAGIGAAIPGALNIKFTLGGINVLRATGAIALFIIVFLVNPPKLFDNSASQTPTPFVDPTAGSVSAPSETKNYSASDTDVFSPADTITATASPSQTLTHNPPEKYCLFEEIWNTSIPYPPKDPIIPGLMRLDDWGIYEDGDPLNLGFSIIRDFDKPGGYGVFIITYKLDIGYRKKMTFKITVNELLSTGDCKGDPNDGNCAVNLIAGIGNPFGPNMESYNGRYIMFRDLDGTDGRICRTNSIFGEAGNCRPPLSFSNPEEMMQIHKGYAYQIAFDLNGTLLQATLNDGEHLQTFFKDEIVGENNEKFLWIGYHFRSTGKINAFVTCPVIS